MPTVPVEARARLVAVFPLRSTPELASRAAAITHEIIDRVGTIDGYEARLVAPPGAEPLGTTAAAAGAEAYIVGQLTNGDNGEMVTIGCFTSATDRPLGEFHAHLTERETLPALPDLLSWLTSPAAPASDSPVRDVDGTLVPTGQPVEVTVDAPISSGSAKVGDPFTFKSTDRVVVDGYVVVQKGAEGQGEVTVAEHSGGNGHPGKLGLQFDWIAGVDGNKIAHSNTQRSEDGEEKKGASSTATIASYLVLGPLGLFAHNFVHGRDVVVDDTRIMKAYVDHSVHVLSQLHDVVPPGYAK